MSEGRMDSLVHKRIDRRTFLKATGAMGTLLLGFSSGCLPIAAPKKALEGKGAATGLSTLVSMVPVHVGIAKGFFEQEGVRLEWTEFAGGGDTIRAVTTGGYPIGAGSWEAGLLAFGVGEPIRFLGAGMNSALDVWLVRSDSSLKTAKDIRGKKVGYSRPGSLTQTELLATLKALGMSTNDVQLVASGGAPETWAALKAGLIDAGWSSGAIAKKAELAGEGRVLWRAADYRKAMGIGIATTTEVIREQAELLGAFMKGFQKAVDFIKGSPEETGRIWAGRVELEEAVAVGLVKDVGKEAWTIQIDKETLLQIQEELIETKQLAGKVDLNAFVDQRFLPQNLRIQL